MQQGEASELAFHFRRKAGDETAKLRLDHSALKVRSGGRRRRREPSPALTVASTPRVQGVERIVEAVATSLQGGLEASVIKCACPWSLRPARPRA